MPVTKPVRFTMPSAFWETLERDAEVKKEFEERVEARAKQMIDSESAPQRVAIFEGARQQGMEQGLAEARTQAQKLFADLEQVAATLIREKEALLHAHERLWCEAIAHLGRRFLIPLDPERLKGLKSWLEESIGDLSRQAKIRVVLAPSVMERVRASATGSAPHWEWAEDRSLSDQQMRVELDGGGILFAPQAEVEKLTDKINEFLGAHANTP